jgi:hypothetical protein
MRLCTKCAERPAAGKHCWCRPCLNAYGRAWNKANPNKAREYARRWKEKRITREPSLEGSKICRTCKKEQPRTSFYADKTKRDGLEARCKQCCVRRSQLYNQAHPDQHAALSRAYAKRHPDRVRSTQRLVQYGITMADFEQMLLDQQGQCDICKRQLGTGRSTHVDHDHATGKVRGLLCNACNAVLGYARDLPATLLAAAEYLRKRGK